MSLRRAWDEQAGHWIRWARRPGHDSYWRFHGARFLELVPEPGRLTLDIGAGEGRLARDLRRRGHTVIEVDASPTMAGASRALGGSVVVGDGARLPIAAACADLAVAFMSLQDMDDLGGAVAEAARVLVPAGRFVMAVVHSINSAGRFEGEGTARDRPFVVREPYLEPRRIVDDIEQNGLPMRFEGWHRPIESYSRALEEAGFVVEAIREVTEPDPANKWSRVPLFLHVRAVRR